MKTKKTWALLLALVLALAPLALPTGVAEPETVGVDAAFELGQVEFTLNQARFAANTVIEFSLTAYNPTKDALSYRLLQTYVNGWLMPDLDAKLHTLPAGSYVAVTYAVPTSDLLTQMNIQTFQRLQLMVEVCDEAGALLAKGASDSVPIFGAVEDAAPAAPEAATPLLDDEAIRVALVDVSEDGSRMTLYIQRKAAAYWTELLIDPVFDGVGTLGTSVTLTLEPETCALVTLDGADVKARYGVSSFADVDVYLTRYRLVGTSTQPYTPKRLAILDTGADGALLARSEGSESLYEYSGISIGYLGMGDTSLGRKAVYMVCENTGNRYVHLDPIRGISLDGGAYVPAGIQGRFTYPGTRTLLAVYPEAPADLGTATTAKFKLRMTQVRNNENNVLRNTDPFTLQLAGN